MATNSLLDKNAALIVPSWRSRLWRWLVQPNPTLPLDTQRRLRFFNMLVLTEIVAEVITSLLILAGTNPGRIGVAALIFFVGAVTAYPAQSQW